MGTHTKKTYVKNSSKFVESPKPATIIDSSNQPKNMPSDSKLHQMAVNEDNGKC
jgi:hypothetical protein